MRRFLRRTGWGLAVLAATLLAGGVAGWFWLKTSLPDLDGTVELPGLTDRVTVRRDGYGIPFIQAETARDAAFALGFVHAQDRFAQMELTRRLGAGRLSEILGPDLLPMDRQMRTFGIHRLAVADAADVPGEVRAVLDAYAAGVNAWLRTRDGALPPEFYALWFTPEPWTVADSLVWIRLMALRLTDNWRTELLRAGLRRHVPDSVIEALFPQDDGPATLALGSGPSGEVGPGGLDNFEDWRAVAPSWSATGGSNVWALSGDRTETGSPMLANDPHLGMSAPGVWYLARIDTPEGTLAGATAPGLPFLILGHNGKVAWGLTTTHGDASDLFVERISDLDDSAYETPDGLIPFHVRNEVIPVRLAEDELLRIRSTRHGPVISDVLDAAAAAAGDGHVLALSDSALLTGDPGATALYGVNRASDVHAVRRALRAMRTPQQNVVYADVAGNIALSMPARVPVRRSGDGMDIRRGWTGVYDWTGFVPFEALPHAVNPASGMIVNANNRLVGDDYPHFISRHWPEGDRARRIEALLTEARAGMLESSISLQLDVHASSADEALPLMLAAAAEGGSTYPALTGLRGWNRQMVADRWEPLVYAAWVRETTRRIFADELGAAFEGWWGFRPGLIARVLREDTRFCDDITREETQTCPEVLAASFVAALEWLSARYGPDHERWQWGDAHRAAFQHSLFGRIPGLDRLTDLSVPSPGSLDTVNRGGFMIADEAAPFRMVFGAAYRAVFDLADLDNSRFIIAPGQSGNPLSPHYGDLVDRWNEGRYLTLVPPTQAAHTLHLVPPGSDQ